MKFEIIRKNKVENIKEQYFIDDKSFDCSPVINVDINISMAYLNLGVDSEDMCIKCLWGFSPIESWKKEKLTAPFAEEGKLRLKGEFEAGINWRIDRDKMWESYFDESSEWYCLGTPLLDKRDKAVKINKNMVVVIDNTNSLKSVWVNPEFI